MNHNLPHILIVDDEKNMRASLRTVLADEGYEVREAESAEQALQFLAQEEFFMVVTDARLGGMSGYEFLPKARAQWPDLPIIMITAYATPKLAVDAIRAGAIDYLAKPFAPEELLHAVARCAERYLLIRENTTLRGRASETYRLEQIVGESPKMGELRQMITTVAPADAAVLILGESGTGKELVAGALHSLSHRRSHNYTRINCAAIPEQLLESELFGHEKGAFTGALKQKLGRVEEADGGTIFLDEIGDMSRPLQAKLLRFLEDGSFTRVGGTQELRVNVRLLAATNRDIIVAIREGNFREDLYHRLNVVQFRLPPLRERGDDIVILAEHFLKHFAGTMKKNVKTFTASARQKLLGHHWPGNVRELRNVIERALILETTNAIGGNSLPDFTLETGLRKATDAKASTSDEPLDQIVANFERDLINSVLEQYRFNVSKTADHLKISRHALRYRLQRLNINLDDDGDTDTVEKPAA